MSRLVSLDELREQCVAELAIGVENTYELEDISKAMWARLRRMPPSNDIRANLASFTEYKPAPERFAEVLDLDVLDVDWLDASRIALFYEAINTVFVQRTAGSVRRLLALTHEFAHCKLRYGTHAEVWYLGLALLVPYTLVEDLKGAHIGSFALGRRCDWPVPKWVLELRAEHLRVHVANDT